VNAFWIAIGVFVLGLMVLVHEWGHFIVARFFGVRVDTFSIGFGPRLFGLRRGPTDYRLSALPLGGYVKMAGDNPLVEREGAPDEFLSKPRWQRALIALAGPATNILMAIVLLTGLYSVRYERPAFLNDPARVEVVAAGSPAEVAGLQAGDVIVEIVGKADPSWEVAQLETLLGGREPLQVKVRRAGEIFTAVVQPELRGERDIPSVGWFPYNPILVTAVQHDMPAGAAGIQPGDLIVAVNGESTSEIGGSGLVEAVQDSEGAAVELTLARGEEELTVSVAPERREWDGQTGYFIGVRLGEWTEVVPLGPVAAFRQSLTDNAGYAGLLFVVLQRLFTGQVSVRALEGPIGITVLSGQAARIGLDRLIGLMAIISVNLAVLNLLPVPILDGGHIAMLAIEGARKRDLSFQIKERIMQLGFFLLLLLFAVVMYNDIMRYIFR
jgi:regulator of sigma E protease